MQNYLLNLKLEIFKLYCNEKYYILKFVICQDFRKKKLKSFCVGKEGEAARGCYIKQRY